MVTHIIADMHLNKMTICAQSLEKVSEEIVKLLLQFRIGCAAVRIKIFWVLVYIR